MIIRATSLKESRVSPNRAMFYALGYRKEDFDKPMIGIANGQSTITPCNAGLQSLADAAAVATKEAGANPQMFGTPTGYAFPLTRWNAPLIVCLHDSPFF